MDFAMGKLHVKDGTPVGNEHLCKSCTWGQITVGYRESEVLVFCTNTSPNFKVLFPVHECSAYYDKHKPDLLQMKRLAIDINPRRFTAKTKGFSLTDVRRPSPREMRAVSGDKEEDEAEVALAL
jgi:hypothetical protein